jgi:nicotinate (nicotinamide) nucleotide adenylyltransferase
LGYQHLRNFEDARNELQNDFDVMRGVLSPVHDAYQKRGLIHSSHRIAMCERAVSDSDWLSVSHWETQQSGWSRTVDTLRAHARLINEEAGNPDPPIQVRLLVGSDLLESFFVPNVWIPEHIRIILSEFGLVVIQRPGIDLENALNSDLIRPYCHNVRVINQACHHNVSSTVIRSLLMAGKSPRYLIHDRVLEYCVQNKLWCPSADQVQTH